MGGSIVTMHRRRAERHCHEPYQSRGSRTESGSVVPKARASYSLIDAESLLRAQEMHFGVIHRRAGAPCRVHTKKAPGNQVPYNRFVSL